MSGKIKEETTQIRNLEGLLREHVKGNILKHEVRPLTELGENYGSEIVRVEVTVDENGTETSVHAVAKLIPPTQMQLEIFNTQVSFKNEIGFYADIVPALQEFRRESGVTSVAEDYFAEFYGARISLDPNSTVVDTDAVILVENLKISGYHNQDRMKGFDLDTAKTILKALANFQATALALRKTKPEVFNSRILPYLKEWKAPQMPLDYDSVLNENPRTSSLIPRVHKLLAKERTKQIRDLWATITHNDLWVNNIMVKESNGAIGSVKFVDFQLPDYGSPATDVIFFLFSSVQLPVLQYHFEKLLRYYYGEFVQILQSFRIDIKDFTYESFREEVKAEGAYQTFHSLFMIMPIHAPKDAPKNIGKAPEWNPDKQTGAGHAGPPTNGPKNNSPHDDFLNFTFSQATKEKICFMVEEAAKRNWI